MNSLGLGLGPPVQWLSDVGRSLLARAPTVGGVPGGARLGAASAAATAAAIAAGAYSLGATSTLASAIAAELFEPTASRGGVGGGGGVGVGGAGGGVRRQPSLLGAGPGPGAANPDNGSLGPAPKASSFGDESTVDPFSLSPVESELDTLLLGTEAGEMMAYCVAVTLEGLVSDGALVEPKTKARFPLMLCEDDPAAEAGAGAGGAPRENRRAAFAQGGAGSQDLGRQPEHRQAQAKGQGQGRHQQKGAGAGEAGGLPMASTMGGPKRRRLLPWGRREVVEKRYTESGPGLDTAGAANLDAAAARGVQVQGTRLAEEEPSATGAPAAAAAGSGAGSAAAPSPATRSAAAPAGAAAVAASGSQAGVPLASQAGRAPGQAGGSAAEGSPRGNTGGVPPGSPGSPEEDSGSPLSLLERRAKCQVLTGVGVRSKLIAKVKNIKVYAFGVYVHPDRLKAELGPKYKEVPADELKMRDEFYHDLLSREVGMTVRLVVHYKGLSMDMVRRAFDTSLSNRLLKIAGSSEDAGLRTFNSYFSQPRDISRGTTIDFCWQPGGKLITKIDGKTMDPIESPNLCRAFFDLYIGDPPVSLEAKHKIGESIARLLSEC